MKKKAIAIKINEVFKLVLEHENFELKDETTADDVDGWESITHMMIIGEVEKSFNIKFKLMDLMNMDNIGDLINTVEKYLSDA